MCKLNAIQSLFSFESPSRMNTRLVYLYGAASLYRHSLYTATLDIPPPFIYRYPLYTATIDIPPPSIYRHHRLTATLDIMPIRAGTVSLAYPLHAIVDIPLKAALIWSVHQGEYMYMPCICRGRCNRGDGGDMPLPL